MTITNATLKPASAIQMYKPENPVDQAVARVRAVANRVFNEVLPNITRTIKECANHFIVGGLFTGFVTGVALAIIKVSVPQNLILSAVASSLVYMALKRIGTLPIPQARQVELKPASENAYKSQLPEPSVNLEQQPPVLPVDLGQQPLVLPVDLGQQPLLSLNPGIGENDSPSDGKKGPEIQSTQFFKEWNEFSAIAAASFNSSLYAIQELSKPTFSAMKEFANKLGSSSEAYRHEIRHMQQEGLC